MDEDEIEVIVDALEYNGYNITDDCYIEQDKYDVLVSVRTYVRVSADSKEDAIDKINEQKLCDLFPNDVSIHDITDISYGGLVYKAE